MQAEEPELGPTALRRRLPAEFSWLYRNDRAWLRDHRPAAARRGAPGARVDWETVDGDLAADIAAAAARLKAAAPPVRVTVAALERAVAKPGWIGPRKAKLPRTMAALAELTESVEVFRARRLACAEAALGADVAPWRIRRLAGLPGRWRAASARDA